MKDLKNIDRLFQEKFRDFEVVPPEHVWKELNHKLSSSSKKPNKPYWLWLSGIAVGLALLFTFNNPFSDETNIIFKPFQHLNDAVIVEQSSEVENTKNYKLNEDKTFSKTQKKSEIKDNISTNNNFNLFPKIETSLQLKYSKSMSDAIFNGFKKQVNNTNNAIVENKVNLNTEIATKELYSNEENNKWSVATIAAPIFLSGFYNKDQTDDFYAENTEKQGGVSLSYGVQVAYKLNKKLSLQSGILQVNYAYSTPKNSIVPIKTLPTLANNEMSTLKNSDKPVYFLQGNEELVGLKQVYGYIEIPIEAKYQLTNNGDFGVNVIGGFSTLFLNRNDIYVKSPGLVNKLGASKDFNSVNFSGNLGVEFEYKVYKNINFNLVPMLKIQTQTLNTENQYTPYSLGLYSGLNLRF